MSLITRLRGAADAVPGNVLAVLLVLAAAGLFAASHAGVRHLTDDLHPFMVAFFRNFFAFLAFTPWFVKNGLTGLKTERPGMHFMRGVVNASAIFMWVTALSMMAFADATALSLAGPLFTMVGAALMFSEKIGYRRWTAFVLGAAGALVIIRPGFETISLGALLVISRSIAQAVNKLMVKSLTRTEPTTAIVAWVMLWMVPISFVPAVFVWQWPALTDYIWFAFVGGTGALANIFMVKGYSLADVSAVEPVAFTRLVWAALIGYFFFAEVPDSWVWIGAAMIIVATTYISRSSRKK